MAVCTYRRIVYLLVEHADLALQAWHQACCGLQAAALLLRRPEAIPQGLYLGLESLHVRQAAGLLPDLGLRPCNLQTNWSLLQAHPHRTSKGNNQGLMCLEGL